MMIPTKLQFHVPAKTTLNYYLKIDTPTQGRK